MAALKNNPLQAKLIITGIFSFLTKNKLLKEPATES